MSKYTRAIFFKDGNCLTITEKEAEGIKDGLRKGGKWVEVQGEFISSDNIARVGSHEMTAQMKRIKTYQKETDLKITQSEAKRIRDKNIISIGSVEPDYYIDKHTGEKMYS